MKTFTVTYHHTCNYGALLQTYALQHTIESLGHENTVFEYPYATGKKAKPGASPKALARFFYLGFSGFLRRKKMNRLKESFSAFHREHLKLSREYRDMNDLRSDPPAADCLISGSDQVWNLHTLREFIPARFLDFGDEGARRISYAASIEDTDYSDAEKEMVRDYLKRFDRISLREQSAKDYIDGFAGADTVRVVDPVFLLTADEWRKLEKTPRIGGDYILCYQVQSNPRMQEVVDRLKKMTGWKIVSVCNSPIRWIRSDKTFFDVSPEEFIGLYDHASAVVSASFHGAALGILFGKPTYGLVKATRGNRIRELFGLFGTEDYCISGSKTLPFPGEGIEGVAGILEKERSRALSFLTDSLAGGDADGNADD